MKTSMLENGKKINVMERLATCSTRKEIDIEGNGSRTISMGKVPCITKMARCIQERSIRIRNIQKEF